LVSAETEKSDDKDKRDKKGVLNGGRIVIFYSNKFLDRKSNVPFQTFSAKHCGVCERSLKFTGSLQ
jgi:hypothetical protein